MALAIESSKLARQFVKEVGNLPGAYGMQVESALEKGLALNDIMTVYNTAGVVEQYPSRGNQYVMLAAMNRADIQKLLAFVPIVPVDGNSFTRAWEGFNLALYGEIAPTGPVREIVYERRELRWQLLSKGLKAVWHVDVELNSPQGLQRVLGALSALGGSAGITYWNDVVTAMLLYPYMDAAFVPSNDGMGPRRVDFSRRYTFETEYFAAFNYSNERAVHALTRALTQVRPDMQDPTNVTKAIFLSPGSRSQFNEVSEPKEQLAVIRPAAEEGSGMTMVEVRDSGIQADYILANTPVVELTPPQVSLDEDLAEPLTAETTLGRFFPEQPNDLAGSGVDETEHVSGRQGNVGIYRCTPHGDRIDILTKAAGVKALLLFDATGAPATFYDDLATAMNKTGYTPSDYDKRPAKSFWLLGYNEDDGFFVPALIGEFHENVLSDEMIARMATRLVDVGRRHNLTRDQTVSRFLGVNQAGEAAPLRARFMLGKRVPTSGGKSKVEPHNVPFTAEHLGQEDSVPLERVGNKWKTVKGITRAEQLVAAPASSALGAALPEGASTARTTNQDARITNLKSLLAGNADAIFIAGQLITAPNTAGVHIALANADIAIIRLLWFSTNDRLATESAVVMLRNAIQYPMSAEHTMLGRQTNGQVEARSDMTSIAAPTNPQGIQVLANARLAGIRGGFNSRIIKNQAEFNRNDRHGPSLLVIPIPAVETDHAYPMSILNDMPANMAIFTEDHADPRDHRHSSGMYVNMMLGKRAAGIAGQYYGRAQLRTSHNRAIVGGRGGTYYWSEPTKKYTDFRQGTGPLAEQECNTYGAYRAYQGTDPRFPTTLRVTQGFKHY